MSILEKELGVAGGVVSLTILVSSRYELGLGDNLIIPINTIFY